MLRNRAFALSHSSLVSKGSQRRGNMLTMFAILLPAILGLTGLVIDYGVLRVKYRHVQHAADSAATAAASALFDGLSSAQAILSAKEYVADFTDMSGATVNVQIPPADGPFVGQSGYAQVQISLPVSTFLMQSVGGNGSYIVRASAVAGNKNVTAGAAVVVLDPDPPGLTMPTVVGVTLPATPSLSLGGLEVLGVGQLRVNGAVLVDTKWSGVDENGAPAGESGGLLRAAVTCMPVVSLTSLAANDIRVTGGVDNQNNYVNFNGGQSSPLRANKRPVPDPYSSLPVPSTSSDPAHVSTTQYGGVNVLLPLGVTTLNPGVYDYINIVTGIVNMKSGVYIIRGKHPVTGISLNVTGGVISGNGVMFYITDSSAYSASTGFPDSTTDSSTATPLALTDVPPSVVLNAGLLGGQFSPMNNGSVYDGILLFQNRTDRRIMVIVGKTLLSTGSFTGTTYAKWGHVVFTGIGTFDARFVVGSMRFLTVLDMTMQPSSLLPAAQDVYLAH